MISQVHNNQVQEPQEEVIGGVVGYPGAESWRGRKLPGLERYRREEE